MSNDTAVPVGLSEIVTLLTLVGSMLTALFGGDWGLAQNAQQYAGVAVVLLPIGLSLSRAIKHHGVSTAAGAPLPPVEVASVAAVSDPVADTYPGDLAPVVVPVVAP